MTCALGEQLRINEESGRRGWEGLIDARDNLACIPRFKHWEITSWYMTKNDAFGDIPPREYLRGKEWTERMRIGLDALILHGVLKP